MGASRRQVRGSERWPRCIYLAGADGTGKTTQAKALLALLEKEGLRVRYVWLRFPRLLCVPLLVYARLRGYSMRERVGGTEHGYWYFDRSWLMSNVFPWLLWLDTLLLTLFKLYLPLWRGYTVVCDRFVVDILVDLMTGLNEAHLSEQLPARLFFRLLPTGSRLLILDLGSDMARQRSADLKGDRSHEMRRSQYLELACQRQLPIVDSSAPISTVTERIVRLLRSTDDGVPMATEIPASETRNMVG